MTTYFIQAFIYLCAAVIAVPLAKRLGLGSVLGYLIAGVVIGPIIGLVGSETNTLQHFAACCNILQHVSTNIFHHFAI